MTASMLLFCLTGAGLAMSAQAQSSCPSNVQSCSAEASSEANTCCVNAPGGLFVQTQFWDTDPVTGPSDSWTIHGLWPDNCDGTYNSTCDSSRAYSDITGILNDNGKSDLVSYMQTYMQSNSESTEEFWEHEWSKHGTCVSTLEPTCYSSYKKGQEAADYFQTVVDLFKTLDTYGTLKAAGIVPSSSQTYSAGSIASALTKVTGQPPVLMCESGEIYQIYYGFHVDGPLANAKFIPTAVPGTSSTCSGNIKYLPKGGSGSGGPGPTTTSPSGPGSTGTFAGAGHLNVYTGSSQKGCLISDGSWYTSGTCATYHARSSGDGVQLSSSKGTCGVSNNAFRCGSGTASTTFQATGNKLVYNGKSAFYGNSVPSGSEKETVYTDYGDQEISLQWSGA